MSKRGSEWNARGSCRSLKGSGCCSSGSLLLVSLSALKQQGVHRVDRVAQSKRGGKSIQANQASSYGSSSPSPPSPPPLAFPPFLAMFLSSWVPAIAPKPCCDRPSRQPRSSRDDEEPHLGGDTRVRLARLLQAAVLLGPGTPSSAPPSHSDHQAYLYTSPLSPGETSPTGCPIVSGGSSLPSAMSRPFFVRRSGSPDFLRPSCCSSRHQRDSVL